MLQSTLMFKIRLTICFATWLLVSANTLMAQEKTQPSARFGVIERLDPAFDTLVPKDAKLEKLADGFEWTEGPLWIRDGGYLLFSDIPRNSVMKWKEGEGV